MEKFVTDLLTRIREAELLNIENKKFTGLIEITQVEKIVEELEVEYLNNGYELHREGT
jgi:hypothetical protein